MSHQRILAKLARDEFVGRDAELHRLISYSSQPNERKLLLLAAPNAGGSEFLRQAYDELFFRRTQAAPIQPELRRCGIAIDMHMKRLMTITRTGFPVRPASETGFAAPSTQWLRAKWAGQAETCNAR